MRASGILLPVFSLPGKYGIGCFSKEAYQFVDFLAKAGQSFWQILPLGPTSYGDSPYQSFSTFAGNPYFISLEQLADDGLLKKKELRGLDFGSSPVSIDYGLLHEQRYRALRKAFGRFDKKTPAYCIFCRENKAWLDDYALFMAFKGEYGGKSFLEWQDAEKMRDPQVLERFRKEHKKEIRFHKFLQYYFFRQWNRLKEYANSKGIQVIGDIPIYVALDSADVWTNPGLFQLDEALHPKAVAGCPPDGFSETGQLWGNPLYNWEEHQREDYAWWMTRMKKALELYDVVRIDHFRGFDEYYSIPAGDDTAKNGHWEQGPGMHLFRKLQEKFGSRNVIAEDLGYLNDSVRRLVADTGYPGMKVLEFAFDERDSASMEGGENGYLPYCYDKNCVAYTGTHDNETVLGWLGSIQEHERKKLCDYLDVPLSIANTELAAKTVRLAMSSTADLCIIPMQDYLGLDNGARLNEPSTLGKNWRWRMEKLEKEHRNDLAQKIYSVTKTYGRLGK